MQLPSNVTTKQPLAFIIRFDRFPNKYEKKSSEERTESSN